MCESKHLKVGFCVLQFSCLNQLMLVCTIDSCYTNKYNTGIFHVTCSCGTVKNLSYRGTYKLILDCVSEGLPVCCLLLILHLTSKYPIYYQFKLVLVFFTILQQHEVSCQFPWCVFLFTSKTVILIL